MSWKASKIVVIVVIVIVAVLMGQKVLYDRREAALMQIPKRATKAQVLERLGPPDRGGDGDEWYYNATLIGGLSLFHSDDMMILFQDEKVEQRFITPE